MENAAIRFPIMDNGFLLFLNWTQQRKDGTIIFDEALKINDLSRSLLIRANQLLYSGRTERE